MQVRFLHGPFRARGEDAIELWLHGFAIPGRVARLARQAEDWGFDGLLLADSQNLTGDVWIELALAASVTSRLRLGPGVTNPTTRHIATTASAAATLQAESGGRAVLGFGRGDSALSQIGCVPQSVEEFERSLTLLQGLLRGDRVSLGDSTTSVIHWLAGTEKVPVHVGATGPRVLAAAARSCEGVDLTVGAEHDRLRRGVEAVRRAASHERVSIGAYVNVAVDDDRELARELVRGSAATFARFATHGAPKAGLSRVTREGVERLAVGYERDRHGSAASDFAQRLDGAFVDRFAVAGPAVEVRERLADIAALGIERIVVVPGSLDADAAALERSNEAFARDVLPALKG